MQVGQRLCETAVAAVNAQKAAAGTQRQAAIQARAAEQRANYQAQAMLGQDFEDIGGEAGVRQVLEMLRSEIDCATAQLGVPAVARIDRSLVTVRSRSDEF